MNLKQRIEQLESEFGSITHWEDRYKKLIEMGKAIPDLPQDLRTEEAKVKGCQSQVWLHAQLNSKNQVEFQGDSDAMLVKGLVALLLKVYSGSSPEEILSTPPSFVAKLGFEGNLTPSRANGFFAMIKQIQNFATVFNYMLKSRVNS